MIKPSLSKRKKLIFSILLLVFSAIVIFVLGEIMVRLLLPQPEPRKYLTPDRKYSWVLKKNYYQKYHYVGYDAEMEVQTNSMGFRDREYDLTESGVKRVLLVGDSYTFASGVSVEESFDHKLESLLNAQGESYQVINTGVPGWGTIQQLAFARDSLNTVHPDYIVLTFCHNDPHNDTMMLSERLGILRTIFRSRPLHFMRDNSHFYRFLYNKFENALHGVFNRGRNDNAAEKQNGLKNAENDSDEITKMGRIPFGISKAEWTRTLGYIKDFHKEYTDRIKGGVLIIQATRPVNESIRENLSSLSNGSNLVYLDLYDDFIELKYSEIVMPHDSHWSSMVHTISANRLYETILSVQKHEAEDFSP